MNTLKFQTEINAPKDRVWQALWDDGNYREWTQAFAADSHARGEWKQGSEIEFLDGKDDGMYARIETLKPNEEMAFHHLGEIKQGERQDPNKDWGNAMERYTLQEKDGTTKLQVSVDTPEEYANFMGDAFPKALDAVKKIAERAN